MSEIEFPREVSARPGCRLLSEINGVHVPATNHGFDSMSQVARFPAERVGEIHLAAHGASVAEAVWSLLCRALARTGPIPALIEWDNDVPPFPILSGEVARAQAVIAEELTRREQPLAA